MVDLDKLENEIDTLLESETKSSLEEWLFQKRYYKINEIIGSGTFISLKSENLQFKVNLVQANFHPINSDSYTTPSNRLAA